MDYRLLATVAIVTACREIRILHKYCDINRLSYECTLDSITYREREGEREGERMEGKEVN